MTFGQWHVLSIAKSLRMRENGTTRLEQQLCKRIKEE